MFCPFAIPRPGTGARIDPDFAWMTEWEYLNADRVWRLVSYNDTAHLADRLR
jgi:probable phosphoglycerate mutase